MKLSNELSGALGAISLIAAFCAVFHLAGCPITGGPEGVPFSGRTFLFGSIAIVCGFLSMSLHGRAAEVPSRPRSKRVLLIEGVITMLLGGAVVGGGAVGVG